LPKPFKLILMAKFKVGVLIPYSGIYKNLKSDFLNGIDAAIPESLKDRISFLPEFVNTGGFKQVEEAFNKLALFESVDVITGIVSTNVLTSLMPVINAEKMPVIISNLGAYIPAERIISPYLFYNSLHLWQSEWAMGKWMQAKYGGIPSIGSVIYDVGYNMHECFRIGTVAADAKECRMHVLKLEGLQGFADTQPLVDAFDYDQASHAHAIFSGIEGQQFLTNFYNSSIASQIPLSVSPFMVDNGVKLNIDTSPGILNAFTWDYYSAAEENIKFKNAYEGEFEVKANTFSLLGYETGLAIVAALESITTKPTKEKLTEALTNIDVNGPRGKLALSLTDVPSQQPVYIRKAHLDKDTHEVKNDIVEVVKGIDWNAGSLASVRNSSYTWQNPYMCV